MKNFPDQSHRNRRFISKYLTLWVALLLLGAAVVLSAALTGSRDERRQSAPEAGQGAQASQIAQADRIAQASRITGADRVAGAGESAGLTTQPATGAERRQGPKPVTGVLNNEVPVNPVAQGRADVARTNRERIEETLSPDPLAPIARTARVATSLVMLGAGQNDGDLDVVQDGTQGGELRQSGPTPQSRGPRDRARNKPREERLKRARPFNGDLRNLPHRRPVKRERPEREDPPAIPTLRSGLSTGTPAMPEPAAPVTIGPPSAAAPAPTANFDGLDFNNWGAGHPPDTNGDVGPTYYIQSINSSIGIYRKSDGVRVAAFTLDTFMSQGNFGNLCDTDNFGDPVVLYDSFEDRWIITDFAFQLDGGNNVVNPPGSFQCIAASKTGDPVAGGWNFYSINTAGGLGDYPKLGVWPDGIYMSVNMFGYPNGAAFQGPRVYAFNKAQMYAGAPTVQSVSFDAPSDDFTILPSNARLQTGTPPTGTPNYFVSSWQFLNGLTVYKFHVDWNALSASTFTGPDVPLAASSWPNSAVPNAPSQGGNALDVLQIRAMMQNQYSNLGGVESLWNTHTVRRANTSGFAAPRWYQLNVTGGTVAANISQAATWDPDGANVLYRFMPSLAVDRAGNMALGYNTSSSTTKPAIKYAGRLATDPINTFSQTEQLLIQGAGTQTGNCGTGPCNRWGDYSAMTLDPDGCTFWFTGEYYAVDGLNHQTRIGSFSFPQCTPVGSGGTVTGTVTDSATSNPLIGATVALGSRTTTTDASGVYTFSDIPAGTYPVITASFAGYNSASATSIVVSDNATTTQNLALTYASPSACLVDTSLDDFLNGAATNVDLTASAGDVKLANNGVEGPDQVSAPANLSTTNNLTATSWTGQTFRAGVTGDLTKISVGLGLPSGTSGTITVEIRDLNGSNPGSTVLATGTLGPVTNVGTAAFYTTTFATPAAVVSGTSYSVVLRNSVGNTVFGVRGTSGSTLANGQAFTTTSSGTSWTPISADLWFTTYVTPPLTYKAAGNFVSGVKDANPAAGIVPYWKTLSWTATLPANTNIQFQAAASNNFYGPFDFVGPDGTAATFFTTSGASLTQFNGLRYLKYKAFLSTTDNTVTPTLNDVTICFTNTAPTITAATLSRQQGAAAINEQIATVSDANQTTDTLNVTATPLTGTGVTVNNIGVDAAGHVTADVGASCTATNSTFTLTVTDNESASVTATLTVNVTVSATPTVTPGGPTTFCDGGGVTLTSSGATGNQWYLNGNPIGGATSQQYVATASGDYTVTTNSCATTPSAATTVTVNPIPATPTITPGGPTTFCAGGSVTLTSSSASGNQWYLNGNPIGGATAQQYVATASGDYTVVVTASGCSSAPSAATTVTVNAIPATPTITPGGQAILCNGGSVSLTSSSATGNQWYLNGNPIGGATSQQYSATVPGQYTVVVTEKGCPSSPSSATTVVANTAPVLTYQNKSLNVNGSLSINPATGPTDDVSVSSIAVQSVGTYTGTISVNNTTGVVSISNAAPAGTHTIKIRATDSCGVNTDATFTLTVLSPATLSGTKTVSGALTPGGTLTYTIVLQNSGAAPQQDNPGNEFTDVLPAGLSLVSASATSGTAISNTGANTVTWNGSIANGGSVTITIQATINSGQAGVTIANQGAIAYDADGNLTNEAATTTDDPAVAGTNNPTSFKVNTPPVAGNQPVTSTEDTARSITLAGSDADDNNLAFTITQQPAHGTLSVISTPDCAPTNNCTAAVTYTPGSNYNGPDSFTFKVNDGLADTVTNGTVSLTVNAVNDAPVNTVPGPQSLIENASINLSSAHANQLSVSDVDAGTSPVAVTLTATNGVITLNGTSGLTFTPTTPDKLIFAGTISDINAAMNGLTFSPTSGYDGPAGIRIQTSDQGFTGSGGALIDDDTVQFTVLDGGQLAFSAATYTVDEAAGTATITVNRTGGANGEARVNYETNDGTAIAGAGTDYLSSTGQLIFADGETSKTFTVSINNDALNEAAETINLKLSNVSGGGALGLQKDATLTITDNDAAPTVSINDVSLDEGDTGTKSFSFNVTLSAISGQTVTVNYATADGTATTPSDYQAIQSTALIFAPGETQKSITVLVNGDTLSEPNETFFVNLSGAVNGGISDNQGQGTINNEDTPTLAFSQAVFTANEASNKTTITVSLTSSPASAVSVNYRTEDPSGLTNCDVVMGLASPRCDLTAVAGTLTFAPGQQSATFDIPLVNDVYVEGPETLPLALFNPVGGVLGAQSTATLTISDDDLVAGAPNPIDDPSFFVRLLYMDVLNRTPEAQGLADWLAILRNCPAGDASCDLVEVSSGFFRSPEFFARAYFIYRFYEVGLGRKPTYAEYQQDFMMVAGFLSDAQLEQRKQQFALAFSQRAEFRARYDQYDSQTHYQEFVDALSQTAGVTLSNRALLASQLANSQQQRWDVLRAVVESPEVSAKFFNKAFVVVGYFAFLRRDPDAAYLVWLNKLDTTGDYREMIRGFIQSQEYRRRFGL